jgi:metal-responsive CopG/Arc/MetJ family transcriptional regulator
MAKKIMISVDEGLLAEIEEYAAKMHLNRSASFSVLCSTALQAQKSMTTLDELMQAYKAEKAAQEVTRVAGA